MFSSVIKYFSSNNNENEKDDQSSFPYRDLPMDILFHTSTFLAQKEFAINRQVLGSRFCPKKSDSSNGHSSHEAKEDDSLDALRMNQAIFSSAVMSSEATPARRLLYNSNIFHQVSKAAKLLRAVEYANYRQAEALVADDPYLMFMELSFKFRDDSEGRMSPLKYAFKVYDTYMWKTVFLKKIEAIEDPEKKNRCRAMFLDQMQEQKQAGHIDLEPLFKAYREYGRRDIDWYALGKKQKELLPAHMLKEFSRKGNTWRANSSFNVDHIPRPSGCRIYNYNLDASRSLYSILSDSCWGYHFSLSRGREQKASFIFCSWVLQLFQRAATDLATFRQLFQVRRRNFANQLSLMAQNAPENPAQQDQRPDTENRITP